MHDATHTTITDPGGRTLGPALVARHASLVMLAVVLAIATPAVAGDDLSQPDAAVEAGREALGDQWNLNWYDAEADDFKVVQQKPPKNYDWSWISWIGDLFTGWDFDFGSVLKVLTWIAVIALLAWLVYVLVKAYRNAELKLATVVDEADDGRTHVERVEALPVAVERKVVDFLAEARRLLAAGDGTMAVVYLFSHQLIELDKRRLLRLVKGKTNRQYLRELRRNTPGAPRIAAIVEPTMLLFERAFFGAHPPAADRLNACFAAMDEFEAQINQAELNNQSALKNQAAYGNQTALES
ncbi:MAG: DUF4129 domain-containing protein [Planctomycetota bacterium]